MSCISSDSHYLMPGRDVLVELIVVFGISDAVGISPHMEATDYSKVVIADLVAKVKEKSEKRGSLHEAD